MFGLLLLLVTPNANAADRANGGVQAALFEDGLNFAEGLLEGQTFDFYQEEIASDPACYDKLGVRDFNLNVPVRYVNADFTPEGIRFSIGFDPIYGENMTLFGEDEDFWDYCIGFEKELRTIWVTDVYLEAVVKPYVDRGELKVEFVGDPIIEGNIDTDTEDIPDDLVLYFFEDAIWDNLRGAAQGMLTGIVDTFWQEGLLSGEFHSLAFDLDLRDMEVSEHALLAGADVDVEWTNESVCIPGLPNEANDEEPRIDFGDGNGSSVALGMTEGNLNRIFRELWEQGYLCFPDSRMDLVYDVLEPFFDRSVAGLKAEAIFNTEPTAKMTKTGTRANIPDIEMRITGTREGQEVTLLSLRGSLTGILDLGLDPVLTALTVSLHNMELDIQQFSAKHLVSDKPSAETHLKRFIEGWLLDWVTREMEQISLFNTQFTAFGAIARVDEILHRKNRLLVYASLYDTNDPEVDLIAPDTAIEGMDTDDQNSSAVFRYDGVDDRSGGLSFSYRVDSGSWSSWSTDTAVELQDLLPGEHHFEVKAKDSWLNEDPTPAEIHFTLLAPVVEKSSPGENLANCNCSSTPQKRGFFWPVVMVFAILLGRRSNTTAQ